MPVIFLKIAQTQISVLLCHCFQASLEQSLIPSEWKFGNVIPIYKSGNRDTPSNYRPISLTSIPCKIMENVIFSRLIDHLGNINYLHQSQYGFRKHLSCVTHLNKFVTGLQDNFHPSFTTDVIFINYAKAFDTVSSNACSKNYFSTT